MRKTLDRIGIYRQVYNGYTKDSSMVSAPSWALSKLIASMGIYAIHTVTPNSEHSVFLWTCYIASFATLSFMVMRFLIAPLVGYQIHNGIRNKYGPKTSKDLFSHFKCNKTKDELDVKGFAQCSGEYTGK